MLYKTTLYVLLPPEFPQKLRSQFISYLDIFFCQWRQNLMLIYSYKLTTNSEKKIQINFTQSTIQYLFVWWCLTTLSTIFQLYHGGQFYWWRKPDWDPEKTTDLSQVTDKLVTWCCTPRPDQESNSQVDNISGDGHWLHR